MNTPTNDPTSSEQPTTLRAASKVLSRLAFNIGIGLEMTREQLEATSERLQQMLDDAELIGTLREDASIPTVLLLASAMLDVMAEEGTTA